MKTTLLALCVLVFAMNFAASQTTSTSTTTSISTLACAIQCVVRNLATDLRAVSCFNNTCSCLTTLGFDGNATISNPCACNSPKQIVFSGTTPYCLNVPAAVAAVSREQTCQRQIDQVKRLYQTVVFPNSLAVITGALSVTDLFEANVKLRVNPVGEFTGIIGAEEYFYGLGSVPTNRPVEVKFIKMACEGNLVTVHVDLLFNNSLGFPLPPTYNYTQWTFATFNQTSGLISRLDASILNLGKIQDTPPGFEDASIQQTCALLTLPTPLSNGTCLNEFVGTTPLEKFSDCFAFMKSIPFGSWNRANSNTFVCRSLHSILTLYRPEIHCPHSGKTGGGKCIEFPYEYYYNSPLVPF